MSSFIRRVSANSVWSCMVAVALAACSPSLNWREVPNNDLAYVATFPDKPVSVTRELNLAGYPVNLTLQAAQVEGLYFAVGYLPLSGDLAGQFQSMSAALAQALGNNIGQASAQLDDVRWQGIAARHMNLTGKLKSGEEASARAYFIERNNHLIEVVLMGPKGAMNDLIITQWFTGFKLR